MIFSIQSIFPQGVTNIGAHDGTVTAVLIGGYTPYQCSADGITYVPGNTLINLYPGNYTFYAKDNVGTIVTTPFYIPTYPQITGVITTNETGIDLHNGSLKFTITGGLAPYYYSIDSINYYPCDNTQVTIPDLAHGVYKLYVYDNQNNPVHLQLDFTILIYSATYGCTDPAASNYNPAAQINNGTCVYAIPDPNNPGLVNNLYESPDQFRLILQDGTIYQIEEPKDWDKISIILLRDATYHGVNYEFTEGDVKLRFDDIAGRQLLLAEYAKYGNDAITRFQFGYDNYGSFIVDLDAYVDYNSYEIQENYLQVGVKRKTFNDLLETRADILANINNSQNISLHSKQIQKRTVVNEGFSKGDIQPSPKNSSSYGNVGNAPFLGYSTFLDFSKSTQNDFKVDAVRGVYATDPTAFSKYIFKTDGGGAFNFKISFNVRLSVKILAPSGFFQSDNSRHGYWSYQWYLIINNKQSIYTIGDMKTGLTGSRFNVIDYNGSINKSLTLQPRDEVYLYGKYICEDRGHNNNGVECYLDIINENIDINGETVTLPSFTNVSLAYETVQQLLNYQTKFAATLKSNLLGRTDLGYSADGCAALLAYTNGYQIRGFDQTSRPMQTDIKDIISGLHAMYCIGMGYEVDALRNYILRIEKAEYFYQNAEILFLDNVSDYTEDIDGKHIWNKLEFGYAKYTQTLPTSQYTLDEFNTDHVYLTPIQSISNFLQQVCKQIASGYAIELTRRLQYADTPVDSWTFDEDIFVISCVRNGAYYIPERLENFTASGIQSPETAYNLRLSPKRMLSRWGRFINSALAYKKPSDVLVNTYVAKNGDLISAYTGNDSCDSKQTFQEGSSLYLGDLVTGDKLFSPIIIKFNKRISWATLRLLKRCFQGLDTSGRNNGFISVVDCNGVTQQGYLTELKYNPESELASFTLRKKYVNLTVPFNCSIYSGDNFAQFEATTGLPAEIEQCIFSNFV
jgi:hypothetical protein